MDPVSGQPIGAWTNAALPMQLVSRRSTSVMPRPATCPVIKRLRVRTVCRIRLAVRGRLKNAWMGACLPMLLAIHPQTFRIKRLVLFVKSMKPTVLMPPCAAVSQAVRTALTPRWRMALPRVNGSQKVNTVVVAVV